MGALGIPSAADIERLTRRLRSVSQRLEGIEDSVDRLDERLESIERGVTSLDGQLEKWGQLEKLAKAKPPKAAAPAKPSRAAQKAEADRAEALGGRLDEIGRDIEALRRAVAPGEEPPPRAQERLTVTDGCSAASARSAASRPAPDRRLPRPPGPSARARPPAGR